MRGKYDIKERGMKSVGCYKENIATVSSCRNVTKIQEETEHKKKYSFFFYMFNIDLIFGLISTSNRIGLFTAICNCLPF